MPIRIKTFVGDQQFEKVRFAALSQSIDRDHAKTKHVAGANAASTGVVEIRRNNRRSQIQIPTR